MNLRIFKIYMELCQEFGMNPSWEELNYFNEVTVKDYVEFCMNHNMTPSLSNFKKQCQRQAKELLKESLA